MKNNTSTYVGVSWSKNAKKWISQITIEGDSFIEGAKWQQEQNKNLYSEKDLKETINSIEVGQKYWDNIFNAYIEVLEIDIDSNLISLKGANKNTMLLRNQDGSFYTVLTIFAYDVLRGITILQK